MNKIEIVAGALTLVGGPLAFSNLPIPLQMFGGGCVAVAFGLLVFANRKAQREEKK